MSDILDATRDNTRNEQKTLIFRVTENMSHAGITRFILDKSEFDFILKSGKICISFSAKKSISDHVIKIEKKLSKRLIDRAKHSDIFELAMADIETQLIERREEIFNISINNSTTSSGKSNGHNKVKYIQEVLTLRKQYKEQGTTHASIPVKLEELGQIYLQVCHNCVHKFLEPGESKKL
ncbi:MAG: hypothetical protein ACR2IS_13695 [Nitrososphaeraceae archaeon]